MSSEDVFEEQDIAVISYSKELLEGDEDPLLRLGVRTSTVAVDRWGRDLERDAGDQQYASFQSVIEDTAVDVLDYYADEDAEVEGADGFVFEGRIIDEGLLAEAAHQVTTMIEEESEFDRHEPGAIVEPVERRSDD